MSLRVRRHGVDFIEDGPDVDDCGMWGMVTHGIVDICPCADCLVKGVCTTLCDKVRKVWDKYDENIGF
jgi:hypothetical protein